MSRLVDGYTDEGLHVLVLEGEGSYMDRFKVYLDGERVPYRRADRRRDGGTTRIETERGAIFAYRALGREHFTEFAGERVTSAYPSRCTPRT
jgi:hypothetical protein